MGNQQGSQLQNLGDIGYLLYGSGHVHGLMHGQQPLIDIERDALHGETGRYLHASDKVRELHITRWHDSLGRLEDIRIENLPEQMGRVPQPLIEQTSHRQYYYDALSQLTSIEMSERTLNFGYDGAGRLRAQEERIKG